MPDYNIYIHAIGTGAATNQNPTIPWSQKGENGGIQTQSQSAASGAGFNFMRAASLAQSPDSAISQGFSNLAKAFPIVAAAVAVVKIAVGVVDTYFDVSTVETGDYYAKYKWDDLKNIGNVIFHPVSGAVNAFKIEAKWKQQSNTQKLQRDLLGGNVADVKGV